MFSIAVGDFTLKCHAGSMSEYSVDYAQHARLVDVFDEDGRDGVPCCLSVGRGLDWPFLVVKQKSRLPGIFGPCALIVPETEVLFLGVDDRLLAYQFGGPRRIWEDSTDGGILCWARHGEYILLSGELELAAWDIRGQKQWTTFVEPPWEYTVRDGVVHLDVMGKLSEFPISTGPN